MPLGRCHRSSTRSPSPLLSRQRCRRSRNAAARRAPPVLRRHRPPRPRELGCRALAESDHVYGDRMQPRH
jgi:hypothetical protein